MEPIFLRLLGMSQSSCTGFTQQPLLTSLFVGLDFFREGSKIGIHIKCRGLVERIAFLDWPSSWAGICFKFVIEGFLLASFLVFYSISEDSTDFVVLLLSSSFARWVDGLFSDTLGFDQFREFFNSHVFLSLEQLQVVNYLGFFIHRNFWCISYRGGSLRFGFRSWLTTFLEDILGHKSQFCLATGLKVPKSEFPSFHHRIAGLEVFILLGQELAKGHTELRARFDEGFVSVIVCDNVLEEFVEFLLL